MPSLAVRSPDGMKIRSNVELQTYLKVRKSKLTLDFQTLSSKIKLSSAVKKTKDAVKPARNMPPTKLKLLKLKVLAKDKKSPKSLQKTSTSDQNKSVKSAPKKKTISIVKEKKITKKSNDSDEESLIDIENLREENLVKEYIKSGALIATKNDNNEINPVTYYYPRPARKFPSQVVKKCVITRKPSGKDSKGMPDMPKSSIDINNTIAAERSRKSTRCQEAKSMEDKNKISAPSTSSYQELIEHHGEPQRQEEILNASKASNEEDSEEDPNSSKDINCAMEDENKTMPISTSHPHNLYEGDSQRQEQILNASNASNEEDSKEDPNSSKDINFAMEDEDKTMPISTSHPQNLYEGDSQRQEQILNEEVQPQNIFSRILTLFKDAKCMMQDVFSAKK